jgi:cytochrome b561
VLLVILSDYLISTTADKGTLFFNLITIPAITEKLDEYMVDTIGYSHKFMAIFLALLILTHILAVLKHHFLDKGN